LKTAQLGSVERIQSKEYFVALHARPRLHVK